MKEFMQSNFDKAGDLFEQAAPPAPAAEPEASGPVRRTTAGPARRRASTAFRGKAVARAAAEAEAAPEEISREVVKPVEGNLIPVERGPDGARARPDVGLYSDVPKEQMGDFLNELLER